MEVYTNGLIVPRWTTCTCMYMYLRTYMYVRHRKEGGWEGGEGVEVLILMNWPGLYVSKGYTPCSH